MNKNSVKYEGINFSQFAVTEKTEINLTLKINNMEN
jgi:hypothetical protein